MVVETKDGRVNRKANNRRIYYMSHTRQSQAAYHEAGHAVAYLHFGIQFDSISIIPTKGIDGSINLIDPIGDPAKWGLEEDERNARIDKWAIIFASGGCAQRLLTGEPDDDGAREDLLMGFLLASARSPSASHEEIHAYLKWIELRSLNLMTEHWEKIFSIAEALLKSKEISYDEALSLSLHPNSNLTGI